MSIAYEIPVRDDCAMEGALVIFVMRAVRLTYIIEGICFRSFRAGEVCRGCQKNNAHLMPCYWEFDEEHDEANPYLPFSNRTDSFCERIFDLWGLNGFWFILQHCN